MSGAAFNASWFRVRDLHPRLRPGVAILRRPQPERPAWVLHDPASGADFLLGPVAYAMVGLMDGRRSVGDIWQEVAAILRDDLPSQDEVLQLLSQLYQVDVLILDRSTDPAEAESRARRNARRRQKAFWGNPLNLKFPLYDPEPLLRRLVGLSHLIFNGPMLALWLCGQLWLGVMLAQNWTVLTTNLADRVLAYDNLAIMLLSFPVTKFLHETGHALAVKRWGGEVREVGIMLLILMPAPYVDASASGRFESAGARFVVGAAGMMVELALAVPAMAVWLTAEPGFLRALAFDVLLLTTVTSLAFNLNPLLRFDGYYMLCDLARLPNLGSRSAAWVRSLATRALGGEFKLSNMPSPREKFAFALYAPMAFVYRIVIVLGIALFLSGHYLTLGIALATWALVTGLVWPVWRALADLGWGPSFAKRRWRALSLTGAGLALLGALALWLPLPQSTMAEGVVWVPESARLRAPEGGEVLRLLVTSGQKAAVGDPVLQLADPISERELRLGQADLHAVEARLRAATADPALTSVLTQEAEATQARLEDYAARSARLTVRAMTAGVVVLDRPQDMLGLDVVRGQTLGFILTPGLLSVRASVPEARADLLRTDLQGIEARLTRDLSTPLTGVTLESLSPDMTTQLVSPALSTLAGGSIALDPSDPKGETALVRLMTVTLHSDAPQGPVLLGERVMIRFQHSPLPMAPRILRLARQVFLRNFAW